MEEEEQEGRETDIEVDGSYGEGGGQILRVSISLSALTGKPVNVRNIRVNRSPPGIRPQHETAVRAVAEISRAQVEGLRIGSKELRFHPRKITGGTFYFDAGTAASTSLILQSLLPIMAFAEGNISAEVRGGTNNPWAPPVDYIQEVLIPTLTKTGFKSSVELVRRGFYPRGGGIVIARAKPVKRLSPLLLNQFGEIHGIRGLAYSALLPRHIVERMAISANRALKKAGLGEADIKLECLQRENSRCAFNPGCGIILLVDLSTGSIVGSDSLGEIGKPAEKVGQEVAETLQQRLKGNAPVDRHLGDQLIIYMALASGRSEIRVEKLTLHTVSCIHVSSIITGAIFQVSGEEGGPATIQCNGSSLERLL